MTKRFIYTLRHPRLSLAAGALLTWIMLVTLHSCTRTVAGSAQDSTYYGRLSFVIKDNATFSNYYSALQQTGYLDTLSAPGPYTVLLPNNDAYKAGYASSPSGGDLSTFIWSIGLPLLSPYVSYDILRGKFALRSLPLGDNQELPSIMGGKVYVSRYLSGTDTVTTVNGLQVISLDNPASNGLISVISGSIPNPEIYPTVLQVLQTDTSFSIFAAALHRTHLDTLLNGKGSFTVLAPHNSAFQPVDSILVADPVKLANLISYHILPGRYFLNDFLRRQTTDTLQLATMNGTALKFFARQGGITFFPIGPAAPAFYGNGNLQNGSYYPTTIFYGGFCGPISCYKFNASDLPASNGVVHMLNNILIP
jgi:uncharacterized surface protein with fasciclin (FAS1) repeats